MLAPRPREGRAPDDDLRLRRYALSRAKLSIHLHADAPTAPDWLDVCAQAVALGAVVVCEAGLPHPLLHSGRHMFDEAPRRMPALLDWLLDTSEGRLEAQSRALQARAALAAGGEPLEVGARLASFLLGLRGARP